MRARRVLSAFPPDGYDRWSHGAHDVVACRTVSDAIRRVLDDAPSLSEWASTHAQRTVETGRGVVYAVRLNSATTAVRHFYRGGWMAPILADRYLDTPPRPFAELVVSERLREAGVFTPRVLAAVVTRSRPGYRGDLVTEWLDPGHDLAALLAPNRYPPGDRIAGMRAAGETVAAAHRAGLDHPDLNVGNVFVQPREEGVWTAALIDLDRARLVAPTGRFKKKTSVAFSARWKSCEASAA